MNDLMRGARRAAWMLGVAGLAAIAGCSLSRSEPPQRHYVLGGELLRESAPQAPALAGLAIGVRRLRLAAYLDPRFLAVREGANRISYAEFHRWGEPLAVGINRSVAGHLAARGDFRAVDVAPWAPREPYDYVIQLHVERFEGVAAAAAASAGGETHMLATWEIVRPRDGTVLARGATEHRERGWATGDYAEMVRALDAGLDLLSRDLAASLVGLVALP
jgi:uncharacterized protein